MREPLHLQLKPAKTNYVSVESGFDFLGFQVSGSGIAVQPKKMDRVLAMLRDHLKVLGAAGSTLDARSTALFRINAVIRGFRNYFRLPSESGIDEQMLYLDGRVHRKAEDVVNQCVNYVYGMLYGEVWRALVRQGLDPYFGFVHGSARDQGSLVFDVIEEFRAPFADRLVFGMLGRSFRPRIGAHGHLRTATRRALARSFTKRWTGEMAWRSQRLAPAQILEKQAASLASPRAARKRARRS